MHVRVLTLFVVSKIHYSIAKTVNNLIALMDPKENLYSSNITLLNWAKSGAKRYLRSQECATTNVYVRAGTGSEIIWLRGIDK